jgi:hypothetical protein
MVGLGAQCLLLADCVDLVGGHADARIAFRTAVIFWNQDSRSARSRNGILNGAAKALARRVFQQNRHLTDVDADAQHVRS